MREFTMRAYDDELLAAMAKRLAASALSPGAYLMQLATRDLVEQGLLPEDHLNRDEQFTYPLCPRHQKMLRYMTDKQRQDSNGFVQSLVEAHLERIRRGEGNPELGKVYTRLREQGEVPSRDCAIRLPRELAGELRMHLRTARLDEGLFFSSLVQQEWNQATQENRYAVGYDPAVPAAGQADGQGRRTSADQGFFHRT